MQKMLSDLGLYSKRTRGAGFFTTLAVFAVTIGTAAGQDSGPPKLHTNEAYVEEVTRATALAVNDPMAVFAFVLNSLPDRVKVYPTENDYYFTFIHGGAPYAGNISDRVGRRQQGGRAFRLLSGLVGMAPGLAVNARRSGRLPWR